MSPCIVVLCIAGFRDELAQASRLREAHELAAAQAQLQQLAKDYPNEIDVWLELGAVGMWAGESAKAAEWLRAALRLDPKHRGARLGLARVSFWLDETATAKLLYEELLAENPIDVEALVGIGNVLRRNRDYLGANARFRRATELDANHAEAKQRLQEAPAFHFARLDAWAGVTTWLSQTTPSFGAQAQLLFVRDVDMIVRYDGAADLPPGLAVAPVRAHELSLSVVWRSTQRSTWTFAYLPRFVATGSLHRTSVDFSYKLLTKLSLLAGLRLGVSSEAPWAEGLARAGLVWAMHKRAYGQLLVSVFLQPNGFYSAVAAATFGVTLIEDRLTTQASLAGGFGRGIAVLSASLRADLTLVSRFGVFAQGEYLHLPFQRIVASAGMAVGL